MSRLMQATVACCTAVLGWTPALRAAYVPAQTFTVDPYNVECMAFSPQGEQLAVAQANKTLHLLRTEDGKRLHRFVGFTDRVQSVAFSPDGMWLAAGGAVSDLGDRLGGAIRIFDTRHSVGRLHRTLMGHHQAVEALAYSPDGKSLASVSRDETLRMWNPRTSEASKKLRWMGESDEMRAVAYSPDGKYVVGAATAATVYLRPEIRIWETNTGTLVQRIRGNYTQLWCIAFSADSRLVISGHPDGKVRLWDVARGNLRRTIDVPGEQVSFVDANPDGKTLLTASFEGTLRFWDLGTGTLRRALQVSGPDRPLVRVAVSGDRKRIATSVDAGEVQIWKAD